MSTTDQNEKWVLGVTLGLLGSIAINTGNNIQSLGLKGAKKETADESLKKQNNSSCFYSWQKRKKTAPSDATNHISIECDEGLRLKEKSVGNSVSPCSSITWIVGTVIFVTGSLLNFASYAFAAQSMLASLESIQFVTNLLFGKFMLKANVSKTMLIGTGLTVMGTVLAVQFSSRETLNLNTDEMKGLYANPAYLLYLALMIGMLFLLNYIYHFYEKRKAQGISLKFSGAVIPLSYSIWSALFGTQSVVQAKVLAELLSVHSSQEENIFHSWFTYVTIIIWISTVGIWLSRLNNALSKFEPLLIIPLLQCSFIFFAIVSGGIFFKEFNNFSVTQWIGFWVGVLVMFSGLILLTPVPGKVDEDRRLSKEVAILLRNKAEQVSLTEDEGYMKCGDDNCHEDSGVGSTPLSPTQVRSESGIKSNSRSPRQSFESAFTQMTHMKDAVIESANMFLAPPTGTNALTDAMVDATRRKAEKHERRQKLKSLQELLRGEDAHAKETILSRDVLQLVFDLGLQDHINKKGISPKISELEEMAKDLGSPRAFRETILRKASALEKSFNTSCEDCEIQLDQMHEK